MNRQIMFVSSVILACLLLWSCAGTPAPPLTPQRDPDRDALHSRAKELWDAILANERGKMAEFLLPAAREKFNQYQAMGGTSFNTIYYNIDAVEVDPDGIHGIVVITNTFVAPPIPHPRTVPGQVTKWIKADGVWFQDYEEQQIMISGHRNASGR